MGAATKPDLNDVKYDAFLANARTLADPEVIKVEPGGRVLLRMINSSSMSAYRRLHSWINRGPSRGRRGDLVEGEALGFGADLGHRDGGDSPRSRRSPISVT